MPSSFLTTALLALLGTSQLASAHMDLMYPPPLKSKFNPFAQAAHNIDSDMTSPLSASGSNFPCKGYQTMLGTPEGASVATFAPGNKYNLTIDGNAFHEGGSCQASLSYDKGKTFTVIQSWVGQCPTATGGSFDFTIPADAPTGTDVLFAWTWFNEVGNREMYMNCASVTIGGGSSKRHLPAKRDTAFSSRPALFTANIGNGCGTDAGTDVIFPNPGPDVVTKGSKLAKPTGTCQAAAGGSDAGSGSGSGSSAAATATASVGAGAGSGSGSGGAASSTTAQVAPTVTSVGVGSGSSSGASSSTSLPGGVFVTVGNSASAPGTTTTTLAVSASVSAPTTLATSTKPASSGSGSGSSGSATTSAASPAGTGTGTGSGSSGSLSGACTNEGAWNCIAGTSFQRCASGAWSSPIAMAAGTSCKPGVSDTLWRLRRRTGRVRRGGW